MPQIHPCLWFDGQAEEAMGFYVSVFPNSKILKVARLPDGAALTVEAELDGARFLALNGGPQFPPSEAVSFVVPCADQGEVDHYWGLLVEGGQPSQCGWLKDRFGVSWQVVPTELHALLADPATGAAASAVMMGQVKLDVEAIKAAAAAA